MSFSQAALSSAEIPPEYKSFKRKQEIDYSPKPEELMRIWMVYVGQGDGILIQLPAKEGDETIDIMVDGGPSNKSNNFGMRQFLEELYGDGQITIEHVVISHHDTDHIAGITRVLEADKIAVESIYHNGLAS